MTISTYIGIENIALTAPQKAALVAALQALGPSSDNSPAELMHWRVRLDNDAAIYRARFQDGDLTTLNLRQFIANVFSVAVVNVTAGTTSTTFLTLPSPIITLTYLAVARLRFVLFGGLAATTAQSNAEVVAYLKANAVAWGDS
jgi:uncharacterized membrane protein